MYTFTSFVTVGFVGIFNFTLKCGDCLHKRLVFFTYRLSDVFNWDFWCSHCTWLLGLACCLRPWRLCAYEIPIHYVVHVWAACLFCIFSSKRFTRAGGKCSIGYARYRLHYQHALVAPGKPSWCSHCHIILWSYHGSFYCCFHQLHIFQQSLVCSLGLCIFGISETVLVERPKFLANGCSLGRFMLTGEVSITPCVWELYLYVSVVRKCSNPSFVQILNETISCLWCSCVVHLPIYVWGKSCGVDCSYSKTHMEDCENFAPALGPVVDHYV